LEQQTTRINGRSSNPSGSASATPTGEMMIHKGRRIISNRSKANVLSSHYASVSRLTFNKEEKTINRNAKMLRGGDNNSNSSSDQFCRPFSMTELKKAITRRGGPRVSVRSGQEFHFAPPPPKEKKKVQI